MNQRTSSNSDSASFSPLSISLCQRRTTHRICSPLQFSLAAACRSPSRLPLQRVNSLFVFIQNQTLAFFLKKRPLKICARKKFDS